MAKDKTRDERAGREPEPAQTAVPPGYDPDGYLHEGPDGESKSESKTKKK